MTHLGISAILIAGAWIHWIRQKRQRIQLRKKYYKENGGLTLQQLLSRHEREIDAFKIYTADELDKATQNYDESRILGQGGQGTVYKGELADTTIVAIKKSNAIDKCQVDKFVNEVIVLSQINHRNVVKLLGCCLETEIPMLVYEIITNGTLFDHIQKNHTPQMSWPTRLRIAAEIAGALSYLHSAAAIPIIHRDIKTTNILIDAKFTAKVSDFGTSKFAPVDKTSLTTLVQGTLGYLDPEIMAGHLSSCGKALIEKSDVFSFGVVLVELLTGERALNFERKEEERSLAMYFVSCMKEDRLDEIVDENLKRQVSCTHLTEVALMAARCLNVRGEERPSMKEVAGVLEGLAKREMNHPWVAIELDADQENEVLLNEPVRSDTLSPMDL
ncbi:hypothetical protein V2J09_023500 [Rumex salicifolius]